ncbi:NAD-dependent epimerase/dehydratase family protein, partial [Rhodobacteraceae bacterium R_SAG6]|nr:NAD-dependent epimerase/dehydratase family protein [Rhodobacteraceae bacterium R_SAG6]
YNRQYGVDYRSVMPTNLYGPDDNFHPDNSHVLPALIRRFHRAKELGTESVTIWGTGMPRREFLHVDDMASACLFVMELDSVAHARETHERLSHINIGCGTDVSIMDLAQLIAKTTGFTGVVLTDLSKPDGTPRKLLDVSRLERLGWRPSISLEDGVRGTYEWFLSKGLGNLRSK